MPGMVRVLKDHPLCCVEDSSCGGRQIQEVGVGGKLTTAGTCNDNSASWKEVGGFRYVLKAELR